VLGVGGLVTPTHYRGSLIKCKYMKNNIYNTKQITKYLYKRYLIITNIIRIILYVIFAFTYATIII